MENTILKDWFKISQLKHSNVPWAVGISYYQEPSAAQAFPPLPSRRVKAQRINSLWNPSAPFPALKCFCRGTAWRPLRQSAPRHSICLLSCIYPITEKKDWGYSARSQTLQDVGYLNVPPSQHASWFMPWEQNAHVCVDVLLVLRQGPCCLWTPLLETLFCYNTCTSLVVSHGRSDP